MTNSESIEDRIVAVARDTIADMEAGFFGPPISEATGQVPAL